MTDQGGGAYGSMTRTGSSAAERERNAGFQEDVNILFRTEVVLSYRGRRGAVEEYRALVSNSGLHRRGYMSILTQTGSHVDTPLGNTKFDRNLLRHSLFSCIHMELPTLEHLPGLFVQSRLTLLWAILYSNATC